MKITKEGIYRDKRGNELPVVNVNRKHPSLPPYFRAFSNGGYYNVNREPDNQPFDEIEWEMAEFVRDLDDSRL